MTKTFIIPHIIDMTKKRNMIGLEKSHGGRTNRRFSLQTSCFPVMSHGTTLCEHRATAFGIHSFIHLFPKAIQLIGYNIFT